MTDNIKEEMKVHFIHGIHTSDRDNVTARLAQTFRDRGFKTMVRSYGYALALTTGLTNWLNNRRAKKLSALIDDGDCVVAHSNGCAIAYLIQREYKPLSAVILIQPALDNWRTFDNTDKVLVLYNKKDDVVGLSMLGFCSAWGDMGRDGYKGILGNVEQWDTEAPPYLIPPYSGHSGIVDKLEAWANALASWLDSTIKAGKNE